MEYARVLSAKDHTLISIDKQDINTLCTLILFLRPCYYLYRVKRPDWCMFCPQTFYGLWHTSSRLYSGYLYFSYVIIIIFLFLFSLPPTHVIRIMVSVSHIWCQDLVTYGVAVQYIIYGVVKGPSQPKNNLRIRHFTMLL